MLVKMTRKSAAVLAFMAQCAFFGGCAAGGSTEDVLV